MLYLQPIGRPARPALRLQQRVRRRVQHELNRHHSHHHHAPRTTHYAPPPSLDYQACSVCVCVVMYYTTNTASNNVRAGWPADNVIFDITPAP